VLARRRPERDRNENWWLIKERDEYARAGAAAVVIVPGATHLFEEPGGSLSLRFVGSECQNSASRTSPMRRSDCLFVQPRLQNCALIDISLTQ
jgi:hypothetical protein